MSESWKPDWSELDERARVRDDILEFVHADLTVDLYPMGLWLRIETNDERILTAARGSFGRYVRPPQLPGAPDVQMTLLAHAVDDRVEPRARGRTLFRFNRDQFYVSAGRDAVMAGSFERGRIFGFFPPSLIRDEQFIRQHFIESGFYIVLRSRGFAGLHGAGLIKNGHAVMLRAWQGTGKSTLAFACVQRGYRLLGEDVVWVHWASPDREWWGAPWTLSLLPEAQAFFPALAGIEPTVMPNGELKIVLDLDQLMPDATVVTTPPGSLVFLERHSGENSKIAVLTPQEAFHRFINPLGEPAGPSHVGYTNAVEPLLARPSYLLQMGTRLDGAVAALDTLFTQSLK